MVDAVITYLELQMETDYYPYHGFICLNFIDIYPTFPKVEKTIENLKRYTDLRILNYSYNYKRIDEFTDIEEYEVTRH